MFFSLFFLFEPHWQLFQYLFTYYFYYYYCYRFSFVSSFFPRAYDGSSSFRLIASMWNSQEIERAYQARIVTTAMLYIRISCLWWFCSVSVAKVFFYFYYNEQISVTWLHIGSHGNLRSNRNAIQDSREILAVFPTNPLSSLKKENIYIYIHISIQES